MSAIDTLHRIIKERSKGSDRYNVDPNFLREIVKYILGLDFIEIKPVDQLSPYEAYIVLQKSADYSIDDLEPVLLDSKHKRVAHNDKAKGLVFGAKIKYASKANLCHKTFSICKELVQLCLLDSENIPAAIESDPSQIYEMLKNSPHSQETLGEDIPQLINFVELVTSDKKAIEETIELLFPSYLRAKALEKHKGNYFECAKEYRIPQIYIEEFLKRLEKNHKSY